MNYDLAMMALEGLSRSPLRISMRPNGVEIAGSGSAFKELARLCLLLGGEDTPGGEEFELKPPLHVGRDSAALRLRRT
jgi:hypothetical protein